MKPAIKWATYRYQVVWQTDLQIDYPANQFDRTGQTVLLM